MYLFRLLGSFCVLTARRQRKKNNDDKIITIHFPYINNLLRLSTGLIFFSQHLTFRSGSLMSENKSGFSFGFRILVSGFGCLLQVSVTGLI